MPILCILIAVDYVIRKICFCIEYPFKYLGKKVSKAFRIVGNRMVMIPDIIPKITKKVREYRPTEPKNNSGRTMLNKMIWKTPIIKERQQKIIFLGI